MKRKFGFLLMFLGMVLMLGAVALLLYNENEATKAETAAAGVMPELVQTIKENRQAIEDSGVIEVEIPLEFLSPSDLMMTEVEIDGYLYIGYLSIPSLELELPIMSGWTYPSLQIAPARYSGTVKGGDLVLMAHNYAKHFGRISELREGDEVYFVDMDGHTTAYRVAARDVLDPTAVEEMVAGVYDLTLFTCTYGGQSRVTVYCEKV